MSNLIPMPNGSEIISLEALLRNLEPNIKQGHITEQQVRDMWQQLHDCSQI